MFNTDIFMNAEVTYREGRVRRDWSARRFAMAAARRDESGTDA